MESSRGKRKLTFMILFFSSVDRILPFFSSSVMRSCGEEWEGSSLKRRSLHASHPFPPLYLLLQDLLLKQLLSLLLELQILLCCLRRPSLLLLLLVLVLLLLLLLVLLQFMLLLLPVPRMRCC